MSVPQPRFLPTYNSLTDKHLVGYFSNARIRRHLQKSGLISKSGRIIPEKEYRLNAMRRDHQRYVQDCLADAIFQKVLDMERRHQLEMKRNLDYSMRKERIPTLKMEKFRGSPQAVMHSPHPPLAPRSRYGRSPVLAGERTGRSRWRSPGLGADCVCGYCPHHPRTCKVFPVIKRRVVPEPSPPSHTGDRCLPRRGLPPSRRYRPTTAFNEQVLIKKNRGYPRSPLCSNAFVTMVYLGKSKHVSLIAFKDEIEVYQQFSGGQNIRVYKGLLLEGDTFQFTSKRYLGYPFSLTFFLNGIQVDRVSCCCEYKHQRLSRLRNTNKYFKVLHVTGAPPCYKCMVEMGLDKKPSPPKRKLKFLEEEPVCCWEHAMHSEPSDSCTRQRSKKGSVVVIMPRRGTSVETVDETLETGDSEEERGRLSDKKSRMGKQSDEDSEDSQRHTCRKVLKALMEGRQGGNKICQVRNDGHKGQLVWQLTAGCRCSHGFKKTEQIQGQKEINEEYDEDFEADEEVDEEGQTGDQMNGMSESSSDDKNHNLDCGKESETSSQKALQAPGSEKDESGGYSDRDSEDDQQERRPADPVSSMSTQCSTDSPAGMRTDNVNGKEETEENQETSALEKKGIDEAEKTKPEELTAREDTRIFHENIMAMQHQNPEVNGEFKQTGSGESNKNEEEKCPPVPWESREDTEDGKEESPWCEEGGVSEDCKPIQEEMTKATGGGHPVNSDPYPGDPCAKEEEKNAARTECDASGAPDGGFLAEGKRSLDVQEAAGRAGREGRVTGQRRALEQDGAAGGDAGSGEAEAEAARVGNSRPRTDTGAAPEESAPREGAVAEEQPEGKGTREAVRLGTEVSPGEQEVPVEGMALGEAAAGGEGPAGALPGWEADRAVSRGQEGAGGIAEEEEEEAAEEGLKGVVGPPAGEEVGEPGSEESLGEGGCAGKETVVGAVSEEEQAGEDADVAADRIAGPEGEQAVEEDISEGEEAVGKPGALWEALGETGETMPGREGFVKPSEFSQLKASGEEWMEMGKAVAGAAAPESAQAWQVGGNALRRAEDSVEESVEPDKGPVLEVAPGLGALGGAWRDPLTEGSSQVEEAPAAQEEGAAEALWSGNPAAGSKAETERAVEGKAEGEVVGGSAGAAGAGSGGEEEATGGAAGSKEEATGGAAGSKEPAAGTEGWLRCGRVGGKGRAPGEGAVGEVALPPPGLCGARAGEPGLVAIAVVGGQAGPGAPAGEPAGAGASSVGTGAMAPEGATGAVLGTQRGTGAAVAEEVSAKGRAAVEEPGRDGEGVADGAVAGGRAVKQEAAGGCEGSGAMPAGAEGQGEAERAWGAERLGSPRHRDVLRTMSLGEQSTADTSPSTPAHGDGGVEPSGRGSAGGEGLCLGTEPQLAETGTARGQDGWQEEGMEQAGVKTEGKQPSPCENTRESEVADVPASAGSAAGAGEQRKDSPVGGSPAVLGAADVGDRSRSPCQDAANPDPLIMSSEQPQDGEETPL